MTPDLRIILKVIYKDTDGLLTQLYIGDKPTKKYYGFSSVLECLQWAVRLGVIDEVIL